MFICVECGEIFGENEAGITYEDRGCYGDEKCRVEISCCPICSGSYTKASQCLVCGEYYHPDKLNNDICDDCIDTYGKDFEKCYQISKNGKDNQRIEINRLIYKMLGEDIGEINAILYEYILKNSRSEDAHSLMSEYINEDKAWFADRIVKEVKNDENAKG